VIPGEENRAWHRRHLRIFQGASHLNYLQKALSWLDLPEEQTHVFNIHQ
jgi:hypothetical protein